MKMQAWDRLPRALREVLMACRYAHDVHRVSAHYERHGLAATLSVIARLERS